jgi:HisA/HisF family protein
VRILGVLDLKHGQVVRAVGGRRGEYRWLPGVLTTASDPREVARAFRERLGLTELYVADLDAIAGAAISLDVLRVLQKDGFHLTVDAGLCTSDDAGPLLALGVDGVVAGLESLAGPDALAEMVRHIGTTRLVFSLDLNGGIPLGRTGAWPTADPFAIANIAVALGVRRLLVLDLAQVGTASGPATTDLCRQLRETCGTLEIMTGGGVRSAGDIERLRGAGADCVLVATALHDGSITAEEIGRLADKSV